MKFSLKNKIILAIQVTLIVVAVSCGVVAWVIQKKTLEDLTYRQLQSISVLKEYSITKYINHVIEELEYYSMRDKTQDVFVQFLQNNGKQYKEVQSVFQDMVSEGDTFNDVFIMNEEGVIVASTNKSEEGKFRSNEEFFINGKEKSIIHGFYYNLGVEVPELIITSPILGEGGNFLGILAGKVNTNDINNIMLEKAGLGKSGESFLVNSFNLVTTDLFKEPGSVFKKRLLYLPQIENCLKGNSYFDSLPDYHGDVVFGYWRWLPETKTCLVTKIDSAEALMSMREVVFSLSLIIGIIAFIGLIAGYFLGQSAVRPLLKLRGVVSRVQEGDFSVTADESSKDEIGELATSFNFMIKKLKELYANINQKVEEKTEDLSIKMSELEKINKLMVGRELKMIELKKEINKKKAK